KLNFPGYEHAASLRRKSLFAGVLGLPLTLVYHKDSFTRIRNAGATVETIRSPHCGAFAGSFGAGTGRMRRHPGRWRYPKGNQRTSCAALGLPRSCPEKTVFTVVP